MRRDGLPSPEIAAAQPVGVARQCGRDRPRNLSFEKVPEHQSINGIGP
jgi:hypothetical protein